MGLSNEFIERFFCNTPSRIEGIGLNELENEIEKRFKKAFVDDKSFGLNLEIEGNTGGGGMGSTHAKSKFYSQITTIGSSKKLGKL